jgi:hypothetical protein
MPSYSHIFTDFDGPKFAGYPRPGRTLAMRERPIAVRKRRNSGRVRFPVRRSHPAAPLVHRILPNGTCLRNKPRPAFAQNTTRVPDIPVVQLRENAWVQLRRCGFDSRRERYFKRAVELGLSATVPIGPAGSNPAQPPNGWAPNSSLARCYCRCASTVMGRLSEGYRLRHMEA